MVYNNSLDNENLYDDSLREIKRYLVWMVFEIHAVSQILQLVGKMNKYLPFDFPFISSLKSKK